MYKQRYSIVEESTARVLTVDEAKKFLRVEHSDDDDLIEGLIAGYIEHVQNVCNRKLLTTTMKMTQDNFYGSCGEMQLRWGKVQSVTSVKYYDSSGDLQTLDAEEYEVDIVEVPALIRLAPSSTNWPSLQYNKHNAVEVEFITGYGDTAAEIPKAVFLALKQLVASAYQNREHIEIGAGILTLEVPDSADALIANYRDHYF